MMGEKQPEQNLPPRRSFGKGLLAACTGVVALLTPLGAGLAVLLDPLGRKKSGEQWMKVAMLDAVPDDGLPHRYAVIDAAPEDKWNLYPPQPIGSVYVIRQPGTNALTAMSAVCPHLGCTVDFKPSEEKFHCPCHNAAFDSAGQQLAESTVSPRDMDELAVKVTSSGAVEVDYRRFKGGVSEQVEV